MTTPSGIPRSALQYWGTVRGAVGQRASTADVWAAINAHAATQGRETAGITLQGFNAMRSRAVQVRNAAEALNSGLGGSQIEGHMLGNVPWQRDLNAMNAMPMYQATFTHTTANLDGEESSETRTVTFTGALPGTLDDFNTALNHDAEALADKYGTVHVGITDIELNRV